MLLRWRVGSTALEFKVASSAEQGAAAASAANAAVPSLHTRHRPIRDSA
jgi:hypothetical protein